MDVMEAIQARHSVRSFTDKPLSTEERAAIEAEVARCNEAGNLAIRLVCDEPQAFDSTMAHYGKFSNVRNYLVLAGPDGDSLQERCGYYGERLALLAQQMGLNTCWVALTFKKRYVKKMVPSGSKLVVVIALGHGTTQGANHKLKEAEKVCKVPANAEVPTWFVAGLDAALLAPTAMNQQSFEIELLNAPAADGKPAVVARSKGGSYSKVDLGIVRQHFELGAETENFTWADGWRS